MAFDKIKKGKIIVEIKVIKYRKDFKYIMEKKYKSI